MLYGVHLMFTARIKTCHLLITLFSSAFMNLRIWYPLGSHLFPKPKHSFPMVNYGSVCLRLILVFSAFFFFKNIPSYKNKPRFTLLPLLVWIVVFFWSFEWKGRIKVRKLLKLKACPQFLTFLHTYALFFDLILRKLIQVSHRKKLSQANII